MAITSAFQAEDAGSIPVGRLAPKNGAFFYLIQNFLWESFTTPIKFVNSSNKKLGCIPFYDLQPEYKCKNQQ